MLRILLLESPQVQYLEESGCSVEGIDEWKKKKKKNLSQGPQGSRQRSRENAWPSGLWTGWPSERRVLLGTGHWAPSKGKGAGGRPGVRVVSTISSHCGLLWDPVMLGPASSQEPRNSQELHQGPGQAHSKHTSDPRPGRRLRNLTKGLQRAWLSVRGTAYLVPSKSETGCVQGDPEKWRPNFWDDTLMYRIDDEKFSYYFSFSSRTSLKRAEIKTGTWKIVWGKEKGETEPTWFLYRLHYLILAFFTWAWLEPARRHEASSRSTDSPRV